MTCLNDCGISRPSGQYDVGYFGVPPMLNVTFALKSPESVIGWMGRLGDTLLLLIFVKWKKRWVERGMSGTLLVNSSVNQHALYWRVCSSPGFICVGDVFGVVNNIL